MAATTYGSTNARITLSSAISGSGTSVAPATTITYCLAKEVDLGIDFNSKVKNDAYGKSRLTPDIRYAQWFSVQGAKLVGVADVNGTTEWLMEQYIAKTPIYGIVSLPPATGSTYALKSWYTDTQAKVYYLKGVLDKLQIKVTKGRIILLTFKFKEAWKP